MRSAFLIGALCISSAFASNGSERTPVAPHQSVDQRFSALRHNDMRAFLRTMLSDEQVADLSSKWDAQRSQTPNEHETAQFAQTMQMLTAPGAEDTLMAMLKPQLEEMRPQMQMMVGMFSGMISSGIQQDEDLTSEQKDKAAKLVSAVGTFLSENDLTDEKSAKKAVAVVCATARRLNLNTMGEVLALDFGQALRTGDVVMAGVKELFTVYGIHFDDWIDHVKTETISQSGDKATVRVHYEIFGVKDSVDEELVRMGARWISTKTAEAFSGK
ncbi:MAG: hypothetical protein ACI8QZ_001830 [Chlamydiales bacterium]|jgi:hypothetical protein